MGGPRVTITIRNPCDERWEEMEPRGEGRHCRRCERTVVDLSRLTRAQAEARVARATGRVCLALRMDARTHTPIFRAEPSFAPRWAGGVVLAAALTGGGCASTARETESPVAVEPEPTYAPTEALGPPMTPIDADALAALEPRMITRAVPVEEMDRPEESGEPTAEQRRLTARKNRPTSCPTPTAVQPGQITYMTLGF